MDIQTLFDVKDKVVLVTGGGRGVGEMIAAGFVANGAKVYIASRSASACASTAARLTAQGPGQCIALPADLAEYDECVRLADELGQREKMLHVLVNNSGAAWGDNLETYPDAAWTKLLTLNVQRVFTLTQKLLPLLRGAAADGAPPARVINIGSINGINVPSFETYAYSTSKAALHMLSRHLAQRLGPDVTVNALALGPFRSKMMATTLEAFEKDIAEGLPMKRIGKPEDVAAVCLWLAGKGGEWVTGTIIPIEGGWLGSNSGKL